LTTRANSHAHVTEVLVGIVVIKICCLNLSLSFFAAVAALNNMG
jgi:hypothetical protein